MNNPKAPRILLVDDHPAVRAGLALVLEEEGIGECCEALPGERALDVLRRESPDMALVGMDSDDENTAALLAELRARRVPVLVCSMHETPTHMTRSMATASGYITRGEAREVARAVRGILEGWMLTSPRAIERLNSLNEAPAKSFAPSRLRALAS